MIKFLPIILFLFFYSCQRKADGSCCKTEIDDIVELNTHYASNFELIKTNIGYKLNILNPESGEIEKKITLKPNQNHKIISLTSTLNGMISILNQQKQLVGISDINYIYDSTIAQSFYDGKITSFGDETSLSLEKIINSKADIIFYSGFGEKFPHQDKLEKLGITIIPIYDWRENHPLGKAEWIKLVGAITNTEKEALNFFDKITLEYENLCKKASNLKSNTSVLAGSLIGDVWYAPGGESYFAKLIEDAGVQYKYSHTKGTASLQFSIEQILKDNEKTNFWINPGLPTKEKILAIHPKVKFLHAFENNTYCYSSKQSKFWEQSAAMPHLLLNDLINLFHSQKNEELYFYKKVN